MAKVPPPVKQATALSETPQVPTQQNFFDTKVIPTAKVTELWES